MGFSPIVKGALTEVGVDGTWNQVAKTYNQIPFITPVTSDISAYVTDKALSGLFVLVAEEEKKIRENPVERTTDLLKRVFEYATKQILGQATN